jgi:hypothetical protein
MLHGQVTTFLHSRRGWVFSEEAVDLKVPGIVEKREPH